VAGVDDAPREGVDEFSLRTDGFEKRLELRVDEVLREEVD
jgi:hypothetical protein